VLERLILVAVLPWRLVVESSARNLSSNESDKTTFWCYHHLNDDMIVGVNGRIPCYVEFT
jgi:hypothetical protein